MEDKKKAFNSPFTTNLKYTTDNVNCFKVDTICYILALWCRLVFFLGRDMDKLQMRSTNTKEKHLYNIINEEPKAEK